MTTYPPEGAFARVVYLAGPLSIDPMGSVTKAVAEASKLRDAGYTVILPHLHVFWNIVNPAPYETWLGMDLTLIERCDVVLRIQGHSPGADREVAHAEARGIQVFHGDAEKFIAEDRR